ncbi:MAG: hypothetical protein J6S57_00875 [Alphaproteobacteria bacterium]|nr:hypothetical protein [Alphaproteobacteria bacterium]
MLKKICLFLGLICTCAVWNVRADTVDGFIDETIEYTESNTPGNEKTDTIGGFIQEDEEIVQEKTPDEISAEAIDVYDVDGSLFEKITNLEQQKLIMKMEAERLKLELELDTLNNQKVKKQMEIEDMYAKSNQQQEFQIAKKELENQIENLKKQISEIKNNENIDKEYVKNQDEENTEIINEPKQITGKYKMINLVGVGNQLLATVQDVSSGQNIRLAVGKQLDGYTVKSISLVDGIVFEKNGKSEYLNIGR